MAKEVKLPDKTSISSNWVWVEMGLLIKLKSGYPFDSKKFSSDPHNKLPLIRIRDVVRGYTETYTDEICSDYYIVHQGDVLIGMDGDFNVEKWQSDEGLLNQRVCQIQTNSDALEGDFLYYYLPIPLQQINEATPSVTVKHLSTKTLEKTPIPLPPPSEQRRIVKRIEGLFEKLDHAKELVQTALDSFETRKAAILHKAFTGELTAKWRGENGVGMESWDNVRLDSACEMITCGGTPSDKLSDYGDIPFLKVYNIVNNSIDFHYKPQFIDRDTHNKRLKKSKLQPNDVVMNIVGPPLRKIAIIPDDYPEWNMNQAIVRFRPLSGLNCRYLYYCLCYPATLDSVIGDTKGVVGQANISITQSRNLEIPLPTLPEQREIVRILDSLFGKEQHARELCDVIDKIDLMKKAILARAFRGELGTNDPSEESATELLSEILGQQNTPYN